MKIKYKTSEFTVRGNFLGIGKDISDLIGDLNDTKFLRRKWLTGLPEYDAYLLLANDIRQYSADVETHKLELTKCKDKKRVKELNAIIEAGTKAMNRELVKLSNPEIAAVITRSANIDKEVQMAFENDIENIKKAAAALLEGDISVIDFTKHDADLLKFSRELWKVFFSTIPKIYE